MLKHLFISGWFRLKPYLNYIVLVILIAPLLATAGNSTSAIESQQVTKVASSAVELRPVLTETTAVSEPQFETTPLVSKKLVKTQNILPKVSVATSSRVDVTKELLQNDWEHWVQDDETLREEMYDDDPLASVELAPPTMEADSGTKTLSDKQRDLVQRLRNAETETRSVTTEDTSSQMAKVQPLPGESPTDSTGATVAAQSNQQQASQQDPVGSSYPIPWQWIQTTQEAISSRGGDGTRYYRSIPVISPDGRYAIYSRVQLEVKPEMYNSRVSSALFVEDRQTKKLQVVSMTSPIKDPLLKNHESSSDRDRPGTISVLVPVSWSKSGTSFLARKFEGIMNTSDLTDRAVIWDRQKNHTSTVSPSQGKDDQEKIAVLLGWSKTHPDHALFRAGEMGEDNWSLVTVASDGTTVAGNDADQPVTFGQKSKELWADPSVAYR
jgi:hypothetical protein